MDESILIPARGGSKRIPEKNIINLCNKPLICYVIEESLKATKNVFVSTDSEKIKSVCSRYEVNIVDRPSELATDTTSTNLVIEHFLKTTPDIKYFACVQPTSPLLNVEYLRRAFKKIKNMNYNSIISVYEEKQFHWNKNGIPINFSINNKPRTQDMQSWYVENGAFYITSKEDFFKNNNLINGKVGFVSMSKIDSVDIDDYEDLEFARTILNGKKWRTNI